MIFLNIHQAKPSQHELWVGIILLPSFTFHYKRRCQTIWKSIAIPVLMSCTHIHEISS